MASRRDFLRNAMMAIAVSLLPKPLLPQELKEDIVFYNWKYYIEDHNGELRQFEPSCVTFGTKDNEMLITAKGLWKNVKK